MKTLILSILVLTMAYFSNAQMQTGNFKFEGRNRNYEVYLPQNFKPDMPLIIALHGYTETIQWFKDYTLLHEITDTAGFITVYPAAIDKSWNSGLIAPGWPYIDTTVNDVGFISALIDTLKAHYDIDMSRVYCCGYSLGGEMTYKLTGELGHRFAAVASMTGLLNEKSAITCKPVRAFPIIHMHGTLDTYETWSGDNKNLWTVPKTINFWLTKDGCSLPGDTVSLPDLDPHDFCTVEKISYTDCSGEGRLIFYKILHGGHHWPGAAFHWGGGNLNMDINANVEILNFFKNYENPLVNLAYAKSKNVLSGFISTQGDTLIVTARLSNPESHPVSVFAYVQGSQSSYQDSLELFDDGLHGDGDADDNLYGGLKWLSGIDKDIYKVTLRTTDLESDIATCLFFPSYFTTIGPVTVENYTFTRDDTIPNPGDKIYFEITLRNNDPVTIATNVKTKISVPDTNVSLTQFGGSCDDISPGEKSTATGYCRIEIESDYPGDTEIPVHVDITSDGNTFWRDTIYIPVYGPVNINDIREPVTRIYPNPVDNLLNIEISNTGKQGLETEIFTVTGALIYQKEYKNNNSYFNEQIDLSGYKNGVYLLKVRQAEAVYVGKVVVR
ncbi:MAG: T9SS type A sorting domain-containing protein [Bacteroidales bacterium]|nr:MAG: T9SS type A sorting domain-containing protein [Bacteroidales bacterium]